MQKKAIMNATSSDIIVENYFRLMKHWDALRKKQLIEKLNISLKNKSKRDADFSDCFGAWIDERSADEIIEEIYSSRVNKTNTEAF